MYSAISKIGVTAIVFLAIGLILGAILLSKNSDIDQGIIDNEEVACTLDAKICPDGSSVGRIPPSCEFAPCPPVTGDEIETPTETPSETANWNTYTSEENGFSFLYPDSYEVIEDRQSLADWSNAVVAIYKDGEPYDVVVELWENDEDYFSEFSTRDLTDYRFYKVGDNYLTISSNTDAAENSTIISTFKLL